MTCEICAGVGIIDCDFCRKNLDILFHCFSNEKEVLHFCSHTCFENYLNDVKIESLNLKNLKNMFFNHIFFTSLENLYFHRRKIPFAVDLFYLD